MLCQFPSNHYCSRVQFRLSLGAYYYMYNLSSYALDIIRLNAHSMYHPNTQRFRATSRTWLSQLFSVLFEWYGLAVQVLGQG